MAKIRILIDTDIMIDSIKGVKAAKELFRTRDVDLYCSILTQKELLSKGGLKESERKRIINLLSKMKVLKIDDDIMLVQNNIFTAGPQRTQRKNFLFAGRCRKTKRFPSFQYKAHNRCHGH